MCREKLKCGEEEKSLTNYNSKEAAVFEMFSEHRIPKNNIVINHIPTSARKFYGDTSSIDIVLNNNKPIEYVQIPLSELFRKLLKNISRV